MLLLEIPVRSKNCAVDTLMHKDGSTIEMVAYEEIKRSSMVWCHPLLWRCHITRALSYQQTRLRLIEIVIDFLSLIFSQHISSQSIPSPPNWWDVTQAYTNSRGTFVSTQTLLLAGQLSNTLKSRSSNLRDFDTKPYDWVGDSGERCLGFCPGPYAKQCFFGLTWNPVCTQLGVGQSEQEVAIDNSLYSNVVATSSLARNRVIAQALEIGIMAHSVIIGISLDASDNAFP
eukprot:Gb_35122 [translate_table: standard]